MVQRCFSISLFSLSVIAAEATTKLSGFLFDTASITVKESSTGFYWCSVKCSCINTATLLWIGLFGWFAFCPSKANNDHQIISGLSDC